MQCSRENELIFWRNRLTCIYDILEKFRWLTDANVIEFFVEDAWTHLPDSWRNYFDLIDFEVLGRFLDLDNVFDCENQQILPPLSVLALRHCVRYYSLNRRTAVLDFENILTNLMPADDIQLLKDNLRKEDNALNADAKNSCIKKPSRHIKPKKQHEIDRISIVVESLLKILHMQKHHSTAPSKIIDIGSGCGHLARHLCFVKNLPVATVEAQPMLVDRARELDGKFMKENGIVSLEFANLPMHFSQKFSASFLLAAEGNHFRGAEEHVLLTGLHTCGDLAASVLNAFVQNASISALVSAGCCYMKLNAHEQGYPLSKFARDLPNHQLSYAARELACHALEKYAALLLSRSQKDLDALKIHCYRAALEVFIVRKFPERSRAGLGSVKMAHTLSMMDYAKKAMGRLDGLDVDVIFSGDEKMLIEEWGCYISQWKRVVVFHSFRQLLAPLVETAIMIDRLLFLKENGCDNVCILPVFDPKISARNLVLLALKS